MAYIHVVGFGLGVWMISQHQTQIFMDAFAKRIRKTSCSFLCLGWKQPPGNEFWWGQLTASGDPACASSTQVAELHNPHINPKVCGANLKVVTLEGVVPFKDYVTKHGVKYDE